MACETDTLASDARCFTCLSPRTHLEVQTYLLAVYAGVAVDPNALAAASKQFQGIPPAALNAVKTLLFCDLLNSSPVPPPVVEPPTVSAISPEAGSTDGATDVTITGTGFTGATSVTIGGVEVDSFIVVNDSTITAVTGSHVEGVVSVDVTNSGGTNAPNTLYTYETPDPPTVSAIDPATGTTAGGTNVTITGEQFVGATSVTIGGTEVTSFIVVNDNTITAVTAAHAAGASSVEVVNPYGSSFANSLYTYATPDPNFASVIALVKAEGTLTEVIGLCTMEIVGAGAISALQSKFGTTSFLSPGTGVPTDAYLKLIGAAGLFQFPGSFTFEMWVYARSLTEDSFTGLFSGQTNFGAAGCWELQASSAGALSFIAINTSGPTSAAAAITTGAVGGWQHLAVTRENTNPIRIFINGVEKVEGTTVNSQGNIGAGSLWFSIGRGIAADNASLDAYFEEVRVTKGVCRYTADFTPPTVPFPAF